MPNPENQVNLYRGRKIQLIDKTLAWAVTIGRVLVVLTELVALVAFGYRFSLDKQIVDTKDQVKQKLALVAAMNQQEQKYRNVQTRLQLIQKAEGVNTQMQSRIQAILQAIPESATLNSLSMTGGTTRIDVQFTSAISASQFVDKLRNLTDTMTTSVDKIDDKPSLGIVNVVVSLTQKNIAPIL